MVTAIVGKNDFLVAQKLREIISEYQKSGGTSVERFDAAEIQDTDVIVDAVRSISLFDDKKLVIIRGFEENKQLIDNTAALLEATADSTHLVVVASKLDARAGSTKVLKQKTNYIQCGELDNFNIIHWLRERSTEHGLRLSQQQLKWLVDRVGPNQQLLDRELEKLALHGPEPSQEMMEDLVAQTPQSSIFEMLEALFQGRLSRATELYNDQRAQGLEPQRILSMIVWQLERLAQAVFADDKSKEALQKATGMSSFAAKKTIDLSRNLSKRVLMEYINELVDADYMAKTNADIESTLAVYFSSVSGKATSLKETF